MSQALLESLKRAINREIHSELSRHSRTRRKQFLAFQHSDALIALIEEHLEKPGIVKDECRLTFSGDSIIYFLRLNKAYSFKSVSPFICGLLDNGWQLPEPPKQSGGSLDHDFQHSNGLEMNVYIYPASDAQNCEWVQVGTVPKMEWKCLDDEPVKTG